MQAVDAAQALVAEQFPLCEAAFLAGSVVRGDQIRTSDLDIVVVGEDLNVHRRSLMSHGWPVELFVHTRQSLEHFYRQNAQRRRPSLQRMVSEGMVLRDPAGIAGSLKEEAARLLDAGPPPLSLQELEDWRYQVTDAVMDLEGADLWEEMVLIVPQVANKSADLVLAHHRQWLGRGKWVMRALKQFDPRWAQRLHMALSAAYLEQQTAPLIVFADMALDLVGGRLFDGYQRGAGI